MAHCFLGERNLSPYFLRPSCHKGGQHFILWQPLGFLLHPPIRPLHINAMCI